MLNKSMYARIKNCQRGAVIVLFALMLPVLFGFMGLGIDVGLAYVEKGKVQDIADSAALAGAAHLADEGDRLDAIEAAVKEYVEANGITLGKNGMLLKATNESWDEKETLAVGQDALVAYGVVSVTNREGVAVDRVRVRVNKRVPTFFVNVLGDFSDGFTVVAKAAAEGEGEEVVTTAEGPGMIAFGDLNFYTDQIFSRKGDHVKGYGNDIYFEGDFTIDKHNGKDGKFMLAGDYYATHECPEISGKNMGGGNGKGQCQKINDSKNETAQKVKNMVAKLKQECETIVSSSGKEGYTYINSASIKNERGQKYAVIDNAALSGASSVDNLVIDIPDVNFVVLQTDGIKYGNVYIDGTAYIEGKNNVFTGRIYSDTELNVYGNHNTYTQLLSQTLNIARGFEDKNGKPGGDKKKWDVIFNDIQNTFTDGSGIGSGGSTITNTTGKLRLVE